MSNLGGPAVPVVVIPYADTTLGGGSFPVSGAPATPISGNTGGGGSVDDTPDGPTDLTPSEAAAQNTVVIDSVEGGLQIPSLLRYTLHESYTSHYPFPMTIQNDVPSAGVMTANKTALQNAIQAACLDKKPLILDGGYHWIDGLVYLYSTPEFQLHLSGQGGNTVLIGGGDVRSALLTDIDGVDQSFRNGSVRNLTLAGGRKVQTLFRLAHGASQSYFEGLYGEGYLINGLHITDELGSPELPRYEVMLYNNYFRGDTDRVGNGDNVATGNGITLHGHSDCFHRGNYAIAHQLRGFWLSGSTHQMTQCHAYLGKANKVTYPANPWQQVAIELGKDGVGSNFFITQCQLNSEYASVVFSGTGKYFMGGSAGDRNSIRVGVQSITQARPAPFNEYQDSCAYYFGAGTHSNIRLNDEVRRAERTGYTAYTVPNLVRGVTGAILSAGNGGYRINEDSVVAVAEFDLVQTTRVAGVSTLSNVAGLQSVSLGKLRLLGASINTNAHGHVHSRTNTSGLITWSYNTSTFALDVTPVNAPGANAAMTYDIATGRSGNHTF